MIVPRYVVRKADGVGGDPIPEDEPCLVIRANDIFALHVIDDYIDCYRLLNNHDHAVCEELQEHRHQIVKWQDTHPTKVADR